MNGAHPDNLFLQGSRGDARVGTVYGRRTAAEYNRVKVAAQEAKTGKRVVLMYRARKLLNDDNIREFEVINGHLDPTMLVMTQCPGSTVIVPAPNDPRCPDGFARYEGFERWPMVEEDGRYVFLAPPGYTGGMVIWIHDKRFDDHYESLVYETPIVFAPIMAAAEERGKSA